ncbi:hypothetical protein [Gellertiella hungarica]|uniref:Uncharacterized protein n=1 Tax=Gellertiella hungarica TaxID=1572859 RepID=A0A7W6NK43_9HYPH|nr:hypothetical protein [Gellertiella hungarica]MBB4064493.1 hypothetical protein [Gellertiella hungarica]
MDITQIYMASPDWIKALLVAAPFATAVAIAFLFRPARPARSSQAPDAFGEAAAPVSPHIWHSPVERGEESSGFARESELHGPVAIAGRPASDPDESASPR